MKKNILVVTFLYPTTEEPFRGVFVKEYALLASAYGHNVKVLVCDVKNGKALCNIKKDICQDGEYQVYSLVITSFLWKFIMYLNPLTNYMAYRFFKRKIKPHFIPDIIHAHIINPAAMIAAYVAKKINKPYIVTEHWSDVDRFYRLSPFKKMIANAYNKASYITVVSEHLKNELSKYIQNKDKIKVIPNVISNQFTYHQELNPEVLVFTAVARWEAPKRPDIIFEALHLFAQKSSKPLVFNLIGNGSLIDAYINTKKSEYYTLNYHGVLNKTELANIYHKTDYLLHASDTETFCLVIAEALCCGVPVLASNTGAIPELVGTNDGMVCNNNVNTWLEHLDRISSKIYDRKAISENNINKFDKNKITNMLNELY